jgi:hypothetical protein
VLTNRLSHHGAALGDPATRDGALTAFHDGFIVAAVLAVLGIAASLLIDDREAAGTMRQRVAPGGAEEAIAVPAD